MCDIAISHLRSVATGTAFSSDHRIYHSPDSYGKSSNFADSATIDEFMRMDLEDLVRHSMQKKNAVHNEFKE